MERRRFLKNSLLGLSGLALPTWLGCAFRPGGGKGDSDIGYGTTDDTSSAAYGEGLLAEAYLRAQRRGKPLLIFVIPEDDAAKYDRGHAFGELLNFGSADEL